jgi:segregation and condensation protein B
LAQPAEKMELFDVNSDETLARNEVALREAERIVEAMLFAAAEPLDESEMSRRLDEGVALEQVLERLRAHYAGRGVNLSRVGKKWFFKTAPDLNWILAREQVEERKLSRAALETLAIIAYHQPTTRAEIEEIRGVAISKGTLDTLLETGWIRLRGRRKAPGRPITYGTTDAFLMHFGLEQIGDLPGLDELKGAGLFDGRLPKGFGVPQPSDDIALREDEEPLEDEAPQLLEMEFPEEPEPVEAPEALEDDEG